MALKVGAGLASFDMICDDCMLTREEIHSSGCFDGFVYALVSREGCLVEQV